MSKDGKCPQCGKALEWQTRTTAKYIIDEWVCSKCDYRRSVFGKRDDGKHKDGKRWG